MTNKNSWISPTITFYTARAVFTLLFTVSQNLSSGKLKKLFFV